MLDLLKIIVKNERFIFYCKNYKQNYDNTIAQNKAHFT